MIVQGNGTQQSFHFKIFAKSSLLGLLMFTQMTNGALPTSLALLERHANQLTWGQTREPQDLTATLHCCESDTQMDFLMPN